MLTTRVRNQMGPGQANKTWDETDAHESSPQNSETLGDIMINKKQMISSTLRTHIEDKLHKSELFFSAFSSPTQFWE
ncbi:hypothetical protein Mapa_006507 [Marchantia paleacea]|nr:hypothetical protein Mapa_006507 [Marchantia paleacea]